MVWPPGDPSGKTLLEATAERLALVCAEVIVVGYRGERPLPDYARPLEDQISDGGPLGGLYTGLEAAEHDHALAVATDMPFLSAPLLEWLLAQPRDYDVLAPVYYRLPRPPNAGSGVPDVGTAEPLLVQTLHAVYSTRCVEVMRRRLASGRKSLMGLLEEPALRVRYVEPTVVEKLDPGGRSFVNLNTPEALDEAVLLLRGETGV